MLYMLYVYVVLSLFGTFLGALMSTGDHQVRRCESGRRYVHHATSYLFSGVHMCPCELHSYNHCSQPVCATKQQQRLNLEADRNDWWWPWW